MMVNAVELVAISAAERLNASEAVDALSSGTVGKDREGSPNLCPIRAGRKIGSKQLQKRTTGKDFGARDLCYVQRRKMLFPGDSP